MASVCSLLTFSLCLLVIFQGCVAQFQFGGQSAWQSSREFGPGQRACHFEQLSALEPSRRVQSEAGVTEYYEENNEQLRCAGLSAFRRIIEPKGLRLPVYSNTPSLVYITQGRGLLGTIYTGCPETYQSFEQQFEQLGQAGGSPIQIPKDEHQKVHRFREGDVIAIPAGVTHWCYNDGDVPLIAVTVSDTRNSANQLEPRHREFYLAGRHQSGQSYQEIQETKNNVLSGFETQLLAEALGVNPDLARRLQSQNDQRGEIVRVERGLQLLRPTRSQEEQEQPEEYETERYPGEIYEQGKPQYGGNFSNGLDENFCVLKIRYNINDPNRADIYNPQGGRITRLNSQKLPILNLVQLSATRGVLRRNALLSPYWNINAHSLFYVTGGLGRVQIVNHQGRTVFDGQLRQRQLLLIPQNYAVLVKANQQQQFEWVSFKTNHNSMVNQLVGKVSTIRGLPLDVLRASYRLSIEQARRLKNNRREEFTILTPRYPETYEHQSEEYDPQYQRDADVSLAQVK
ncbi:Glutelin type-A 1 [Carex littledalei]|uniref:Glutelin type-A 1 n=1 Tax=Carex littledalei TaxID=544730 RepID=A0A833V9J4_9POAL|nr:Glutelin type-A 1 [Carex littledalei]